MRMDVDLHLNGAYPDSSYVSLEELTLIGLNTSLTMSGEVRDIWRNPAIRAEMKGQVDFTRLAKEFLNPDTLLLEGTMMADLSTVFKVDDIVNSRFAKVKSSGNLTVDRFKAFSKPLGVDMYIAGANLFVGSTENESKYLNAKGLLSANLSVDTLNIKYKDEISTNIGGLKMVANTTPVIDTTAVIPMTAGLEFDHLRTKLPDSTWMVAGKTVLKGMELIEVNSYTENEKYHIAKDYLIPKQLEKNGLSKEQLNITGSALEKMIHSYTRESGVRNLERRVGDICRKAAREVLEKKKPSIRVTERNLDHYLGREKVFFDAAGNEAQVGIVRGLAWTSVGGDTLQIEVNVMPGKGVLQMTGQMGDVMKESAQIALTYVRSVASDYGVKENYFEKHDIHLHIPEGAVPKDGPSAGITMATAMLSAVTGRKVLPRVAMTGEVTLRGHVLMIGGLKEKLLAARMAQVEKVLVPAKNQPDVEELSKEITKGMEIVYIKEMNEVIREAFVPEK